MKIIMIEVSWLAYCALRLFNIFNAILMRRFDLQLINFIKKFFKKIFSNVLCQKSQHFLVEESGNFLFFFFLLLMFFVAVAAVAAATAGKFIFKCSSCQSLIFFFCFFYFFNFIFFELLYQISSCWRTR